MLWLEIAVGALLVKSVYDIWRDARRDTRLGNMEWLQTERLDVILEARKAQKEAEAAQRTLRVLRAREQAANSQPVARRVGGVPSGPMSPLPLLDPWARNGHNG